MKRKMLEDMGLSKEIIDAIMEANGADIEAQKKIADTYKTELDGVQEKLKAFDGVNLEELQGKVRTLTNDLETTRANHAKELDELRFQSVLTEKINSFKPRNSKAVMPFLDIDKLRDSKNQDADIAAALEKVKKENGYLFEDEKPAPRVVAGTSTSQVDGTDRKAQANEAFRALLGKEN